MILGFNLTCNPHKIKMKYKIPLRIIPSLIILLAIKLNNNLVKNRFTWQNYSLKIVI